MKKKFYFIVIGLILSGVIFLLLALSPYGNFSEQTANNINSILIGFGTSFVVTAFTISFIQDFLNKYECTIQEKTEIKKEKEELLRTDKIISILLFKYLKYFYDIVVPISKRNKNHFESVMPIITDFEFKDMRDLHLNTTYSCDDFSLSSIELFYKAEKELRNYFIQVISINSLNYHTEVRDILLKFIELSLANFHKDGILKNLTTLVGDKKMTTIIYENFNDTSKDWLAEYKAKRLKGHIMLPYVMLYFFLKDEIQLIYKYLEEIKKIK